jgi:hypothetical protein
VVGQDVVVELQFVMMDVKGPVRHGLRDDIHALERRVNVDILRARCPVEILDDIDGSGVKWGAIVDMQSFKQTRIRIEPRHIIHCLEIVGDLVFLHRSAELRKEGCFFTEMIVCVVQCSSCRFGRVAELLFSFKLKQPELRVVTGQFFDVPRSGNLYALKHPELIIRHHLPHSVAARR